MNARRKFIVASLMLALILLIAAILHVNSGMRGGALYKNDLYKECLTTDYDKFQCYSMIYGNS